MINHPGGSTVTEDPYIMEESDPLKSNAIYSSLWEIKTLQYHAIPNIATIAKFINSPLPTVEWDMGKLLEETGNDIFDKELRKYGKVIALAFERPTEKGIARGEKTWSHFTWIG